MRDLFQSTVWALKVDHLFRRLYLSLQESVNTEDVCEKCPNGATAQCQEKAKYWKRYGNFHNMQRKKNTSSLYTLE